MSTAVQLGLERTGFHFSLDKAGSIGILYPSISVLQYPGMSVPQDAKGNDMAILDKIRLEQPPTIREEVYKYLTANQLKQLCKKEGIKGYSSKNKIQLIMLLLKPDVQLDWRFK